MIVTITSQKMLPQDAEDIAEETIVSAWFKARQFDRTRASLKTWIMSIAKRRMIDHWRRGRARIKGVPIELAGGVAKSERFVDDDGRSDRALREMSPAQRDYFELFARGNALWAIASLSGTPIGTVKSRMNAARKSAWLME